MAARQARGHRADRRRVEAGASRRPRCRADHQVVAGRDDVSRGVLQTASGARTPACRVATVISRESFVALRYRNFRLLWIGLLVSFVGSTMQSAALLWHV